MDDLSECKKTCWLIAGIAGILVLIVLWLLVGVGFFSALVWAVILGVVLGFALQFFLCSERHGERAVTPDTVRGVDEPPEEHTGEERSQAGQEADAARQEAEAAEVEAARRAAEERHAAEAEAEAARAEAARREAEAEAEATRTEAARKAAEQETAGFAEAPAAAPRPDMEGATSGDFDHASAVEGVDEGTRPPGLDAARGGVADDLKKIKGVGPKLERVLNELGFFHFDQIAAWSAEEVAWVDAEIGGLTERVKRDGWVDQARLLASGGETEFSRRVDRGDVY